MDLTQAICPRALIFYSSVCVGLGLSLFHGVITVLIHKFSEEFNIGRIK